MRDLDRWKDKVELSLDGRQIFFLFFGSAVAACLIFVVGVLIGKRIEARALALQPAPLEDPLAALDQLGDADDDELTFHKALTPAHDKKGAVVADKGERGEKLERAVDKAELADDIGDARVEVKVADKADAKSDGAKGEAAKADAKGDKADKSEGVAKADKADKSDKLEARNDKADKGDVKAPVKLPTLAGKPLLASAGKPQLPSATAKKPDVAVKKPDGTPGHFTLQLSAFPDKSDAEEFMHKIQSAGYKPFLVASEIPGKGIFYRVRVGDYASRQSAVDAKAEFERKQRIIAYVAKL